jgi:anti-sigma B factor antagonist
MRTGFGPVRIWCFKGNYTNKPALLTDNAKLLALSAGRRCHIGIIAAGIRKQKKLEVKSMYDEFDMIRNDLVIGQAVMFEVKGRITTATAGFFGEEMDKAFGQGYTHMSLDMSQVSLLTSAGIRMILKAYKQAKSAGGVFVIEESSQNVKNVLGLSALEKMMM